MYYKNLVRDKTKPGLSLSFLVQGPGPIGLRTLSTFWVNLGSFTLTQCFKKLLKHVLIVLKVKFVKLGISSLENWEFWRVFPIGKGPFIRPNL